MDRFIIIHVLAGGRPSRRWRSRQERKNFNPRPRGEGDNTRFDIFRISRISIHALAGRATRRIDVTSSQKSISIHALAGRATEHGIYGICCVEFQSTPSRGGRLNPVIRCFVGMHFNPRPRGEGDVATIRVGNNIRRFQSTPSRGGRPQRFTRVAKGIRISIHALAGRATFRGRINIGGFAHFNPRPRGEGDPVQVLRRSWNRHFNPRPRGEGDRPFSGTAARTHHFNPRPRGEGDPRRFRRLVRIGISIHALAGRATLCAVFRGSIRYYFNPRPRGEGDLCVLFCNILI